MTNGMLFIAISFALMFTNLRYLATTLLVIERLPVGCVRCVRIVASRIVDFRIVTKPPLERVGLIPTGFKTLFRAELGALNSSHGSTTRVRTRFGRFTRQAFYSTPMLCFCEKQRSAIAKRVFLIESHRSK